MPRAADYYHPRRCECGVMYTPTSGTQKWCPVCGEKHARERQRYAARKNRGRWDIDKEKRRARDKRYRLKHADRLCELKRGYNRAYRERKKLQKQAATNPTAAFRLLSMTGKILECPRLHVRARSLPCGQRLECFGGVRCAHCPSEAMPPRVMDLGGA